MLRDFERSGVGMGVASMERLQAILGNEFSEFRPNKTVLHLACLVCVCVCVCVCGCVCVCVYILLNLLLETAHNNINNI